MGSPSISSGAYQATALVSSPSGRGVPEITTAVEHGRDICSFIAVRVVDAELRATEDVQQTGELDGDAGFLKASRMAASLGDSSGSMEPPIVCHSPVSMFWTRRRRPSDRLGSTATDGRSSRACPIVARRSRM